MNNRIGYWSVHEYHRLNVKDYVDDFVGWSALLELLELPNRKRDKSFLAFLFATGGRVSEVLKSRRQHFQIKEKVIVVRRLPLVKHFEKTGEYFDPETGEKRWETKPLKETRKNFPIYRREPTTPILVEWLETQKEMRDLLFPSPINIGDPLSRFWAYNLVRSIDDVMSDSLRAKLYLDRKWMEEEKKIADSLHLWCHWFRSQRASQLVFDYEYKTLDLVKFFSWENPKEAIRYAQKGWRGLLKKMEDAKPQYV